HRAAVGQPHEPRAHRQRRIADKQRGERHEADRRSGCLHRARLARERHLAIAGVGFRKGMCTMAMRSWLFVPGDSDAKLEKVAGCGSDVVIVDLEDAVAPPAKPHARIMARSWLERQGRKAGGPARWVRINPLDTQLWREDLAAVMPGRPDGVMVPK